MTEVVHVIVCLFVCWCFEPIQPLRVTSELNTNSNISLAHKSFNINHNISTVQLFQTYTNTHTQSRIFVQNLKLSISRLKSSSTQNLLQNTLYFIEHTNLFKVVKNFSGFTFRNNEYKYISPDVILCR